MSNGRRRSSITVPGATPAGHVSQPAGPSAQYIRYPLGWWFDIASDVARRIGGRVGRIPARIYQRIDQQRMVRLRPGRMPRGYLLLSYMIEPFFQKPDEPKSNTHSRFWETWDMASAFIEQDFAVDVIRYTNQSFMPRRHYDFIIDARWNLGRLASALGPDCLKIMHLDTSQLLFHSAAEMNRLLALYRRRGIVLRPRRFERPNHSLEMADCATLLGNAFTRSTYGPVQKPIYLLPVTPATLHAPTRPRDPNAIRRNFLWFNSMGMVHKGLDLTLEAFAAMPDMTLTVCGMVLDEQDFVNAYRRELFETPNIRTVGWVDAGSAEFREILDTSVALISPSCSEGQSGSAVTCLHAGLIPILSRECGIDVDDDFGITLETCSVAQIQSAVRHVASLPTEKLEQMSRATVVFAQANHTRERFGQIYRDIVRELIDHHDR